MQEWRSGESFGLLSAVMSAVAGVLGDMAGVRFEELLSWLENGMGSEKVKLGC